MTRSYDTVHDWLSALEDGQPVAIMPTSLAADVLDETAGSIAKKLKSGHIEAIVIAGKSYVSADSIFRTMDTLKKQIDDVSENLETVARLQGKTFYGDVMEKIGLSWKSPPDRARIGYILGQISRQSWKKNRIFLSSLVHRKGGEPTSPGPGYITLILSIAKGEWERDESEAEMINRHMRKVWKYYRK